MRARTRLGIVGGLVLAIIGIHYAGLGRWVLDQIQERHDGLLALVQTNYSAAVVGYILVYAVAMSCAIPIGAVLTLTGGYLFGTVLGSVYALIGAVIGGTVIFSIVRRFFGRRLQRRYAHRLQAFNQELHEHGSIFLLAIRCIVIIPYSLVNVLAGLTRIPFSTFIWTSTIGLVPSMLVYTFAGQQLTHIQTVYDIFSAPLLGAFVVLSFLALVPFGISYVRKRKRVSS